MTLRIAPEELDLVVIGSGAAAFSVAMGARDAGWSVMLVDERPLGGTCALRGCDPKKALVAVTRAFERARRLPGVAVDQASVPWSELVAFERQFTDPVPERREEALTDAGVVVRRARARFLSESTLDVGGEEVGFRHAHLATGARPRPLAFPGAEHLTTSDDFLFLDRLPERIAFVGGGYVSFELAHVAARAGAEVTLLHRSDRPLGAFDVDLVDLLVEATRAAGIEVRLGAEVTAVRPGLRLESTTGVVEADLAVHGAGRVPLLDGLDLDAAGIAHDAGGVRVDAFQRSVSRPHVTAAGDCASTGLPKLTPTASAEAAIALATLLHGPYRPLEAGPVPMAVFTDPPLARVGATLEEVPHAEVSAGRMDDWQSVRRAGGGPAAYKLLFDPLDGRLIGAHLLGPDADELVNVLALAIRCRLGRMDLRNALFAWPTAASDITSMLRG